MTENKLTVTDKIDAIAFKPDSRFMVALRQTLPLNPQISAEALMRGALQVIKKSDYLQKCNEFSLFASIVEAGQAGLSLDLHLGQAYLVPIQGECQMWLGWRGMCELARRSGEISEIVSEIRYSKDDFRITLGSHRDIHHVPFAGPASKRGEILGAYAVAIPRNPGAAQFEYMDIEQIDAIRNVVLKKKKSSHPSPWETHSEEMIRKTPIRRLAKRLPQSPAMVSFIAAAVRDEYRQQGFREPAQVPVEVRTVMEEEGIKEPPEKPIPEMPREKRPAKPKAEQPTAKISEKQRQEFFRIAGKRTNNVDDTQKLVRSAVQSFGFKESKDVTVDKYESVCAALRGED